MRRRQRAGAPQPQKAQPLLRRPPHPWPNSPRRGTATPRRGRQHRPPRRRPQRRTRRTTRRCCSTTRTSCPCCSARGKKGPWAVRRRQREDECRGRQRKHGGDVVQEVLGHGRARDGGRDDGAPCRDAGHGRPCPGAAADGRREEHVLHARRLLGGGQHDGLDAEGLAGSENATHGVDAQHWPALTCLDAIFDGRGGVGDSSDEPLALQPATPDCDGLTGERPLSRSAAPRRGAARRPRGGSAARERAAAKAKTRRDCPSATGPSGRAR